MALSLANTRYLPLRGIGLDTVRTETADERATALARSIGGSVTWRSGSARIVEMLRRSWRRFSA